MINSREYEYIYGGVKLFNIRNRNERRIIRMLSTILDEYPGYNPNSIDIRDIYALALNSLPARYVQVATIVLREPVSDEQVAEAVRGAVERVMSNPKGAGYDGGERKLSDKSLINKSENSFKGEPI